MKKKIVFLNILLLSLVFSSCNLFNNGPKMRIINNSVEEISSIQVKSYIGVNSKTNPSVSNDSLAEGQTVPVDGEVFYNLPLSAPGSNLYVVIHTEDDANSSSVKVIYDSDANFNLKYNGKDNDPIFSISGEGAELVEDDI